MIRTKIATLAAAMAIAGCASVPQSFEPLEKSQARYEKLSNDDALLRYGRDNLDAANNALNSGSKALTEGAEDAELQHYATVANLNLSIAEEKRDAQLAKRQISNASDERRDIMLAARERDAANAERAAQRAMARAQTAEQRANLAEETALDKQRRLEAREAELAAAKEQAALLAEQLSELQLQENERGMVLTLGDIVFDYDKAELKPGGRRAVEKIAVFLNEQDDRNVVIEGFTDAQGSETYNQGLSERRARAVKDLLTANGVDPNRINSRGLGEQYPVASNDNPAGRQQNRRVEIIVGNPGEPVEARS